MWKNKKIKLEEIFLSTINPRIKNIDLNISGDYFRNGQNSSSESQRQTMINILSYEGSLSDMKDLIQSLSFKYNSMLPKPFVIQDQLQNSFIVIEGNRRILSLKLLHGLFTMPNKKDLKQIANDGQYNESEKNNKNEIRLATNYEIIKKIIANYPRTQFFELEVSYIKKNDYEANEIKVAIFSNHITGKSTGKRNWNRGKTLVMYLNFLGNKSINDKNKIEEIASLLNRSISNVKSNLNSAILIKNIIKQADEDVSEYFIHEKASPLERQFIKKFVNADGYNHFDEFIKIEKNKFVHNSKQSEDFCKFIIKSHREGILTTRLNNPQAIVNHPIYQEFVYGVKQTKHAKKITSDTLIEDIIYRTIDEDLQTLNKEDKKIFEKLKSNKNVFEYFQNTLKIFVEKFTDSKYSTIKVVVNKLYQQVSLLIKKLIKIEDFYFDGIITTSRALSEFVIQILLLSPKFQKIFVENCRIKEIFKNDTFLETLKIKNKERMNDEFFDNIKSWIFRAKLQNTSSIFSLARKMFEDKTLTIDLLNKFLNEFLNEVQRMPLLKPWVWNWIFCKERYEHEFGAIHNTHFFEIKKEGVELLKIVEFFINNLKTFKDIIENIFN